MVVEKLVKRIIGVLICYFPPCGAIGSKRWGEFFDISQENKNISFSVLTANWKGEKIFII